MILYDLFDSKATHPTQYSKRVLPTVCSLIKKKFIIILIDVDWIIDLDCMFFSSYLSWTVLMY